MPSTLYNPDGSRTGVRINARSRRTKHMGGEPTSGLFTQPTKSEQIAISERARARRDAAAASTASAPAASAPAVKKPDGMLVPGRGGSSVWKTQDQIKADAEKSASRAAARRSMSDRDKAVLETKTADTARRKAFSRWRVQSEAYINDPKWSQGVDQQEAAAHRQSLMKTMATQKERDEFFDHEDPAWWAQKNAPQQRPQTSDEWNQYGRQPLY